MWASETQYHDLQVEIYLALDHPHIARLMMVYEDDQAGKSWGASLHFSNEFWFKVDLQAPAGR